MTGSEKTRLKVAVVGGSGYVGGELLRLLLPHPAVGDVRAFSESHAGETWGGVHPSLAHLGGGKFEPPDTAGAAAWADVLFFALPHGRSQEVIPEIPPAGPPLVIDLAADFRIHDQTLYSAYYGEHKAPSALEGFVYGLADVEGSRLRGKGRIAVPGCFATAALLAVHPLAAAGLLGETPTVFAVTGSTGSGVKPKRTTHHPVRAHNFFGYSQGGHRHEAEAAEQIRRWSGEEDGAIRILTHSAPIVRGIHATLLARVKEPLPDPGALFRKAYEGRPFVTVMDSPPELAAVVGSNHAHLHALSREGDRVVVVDCAEDNLVKGAAGQAVQVMNLALGHEETLGLGFGGLYPC